MAATSTHMLSVGTIKEFNSAKLTNNTEEKLFASEMLKAWDCPGRAVGQDHRSSRRVGALQGGQA